MKSSLPILFIPLLFFFATFKLSAQEVPFDPNQLTPLGVNDMAPNSMVRTMVNEDISLDKARGDNPSIVVFYRGGWCPFCNLHLAALARIKDQLVEMGYRMIALSPDKPDEVKKTLNENNYTFMLLSDNKMEAAKAFGVAYKLRPQQVKELKEKGFDLQKSTGQDHNMLPIVSVFLIDTEGVIRYQYANAEFRDKLNIGELLAAAQANKAS